MTRRISMVCVLLPLAVLLCPAHAVASMGAQANSGQARHQKVGDRLTITLSGGRKVELQDVVSDSPKVESAVHTYLEYLPGLRQHLVEVIEYEGYHQLLIDDRNGNKTVIAGKPVVAPNGKRFACRMVNMVIGFARVEVWEILPQSFRLEFKYEPNGIPGSVEWMGSAGILVNLVDVEEKTILGHEYLRRGSQGWVRSEQ